MKNPIRYYLLIAIAAFAIYANSLGNDFVFDDESVVVGDQSLTKLSNIPKYFTGQEGFHKIIGRYYRPVVSTTYNLDYAIHGLKPFGFHLTNVLIHVVNSLLVLQILLMIFYNRENKNKFSLYAVIIGAILFAVHPIRTEAVSWVSGRTDSLSFTFFALALIYFLKFDKLSNTKNLVLICIWYFLSLLSKEMAVTFPVVIIIYDFIVNKRRTLVLLKPRFKLYIIVTALTLLYFLLRWLILKDVPQRETYFYFYGKDFASIFFTMLTTLPLYFRLTIVPVSLLYHYNGYLPYASDITSFQVIFAIIFIAAMFSIAYYLLNRMPMISFSILFFFVTLIPVMNIVPTMNFMAERFLYLPALIFSFGSVYLLLRFYSSKREKTLYVFSGIIIIVFAYITLTRNAEWKDNNTLFLSAEGKQGTVTFVNIGNIYANSKQFDIAEKYYRDALAIKQENVLANVNIGKIFLVKGNFDSAFKYMDYSRTLDTLSPEPLHALGMLCANFNKIPEAVLYLEKVQTIMPNYMNSTEVLDQLKIQKPIDNEQTTNDKGIVSLEQKSYELYQQKKYDESVKILLELVKLNPTSAAGYYNNAGMCYFEQAKFADAEKYYLLSIKSDDKFKAAYNNLVTLYEKSGDVKKAEEYRRKGSNY